MNRKITEAVLKRIQDKRPDELVFLILRTNTVLATDEITLLTVWGGRLLYDNGMMSLLNLPVGKVNDIATWECVLEVR